jgi:hypothetical protein
MKSSRAQETEVVLFAFGSDSRVRINAVLRKTESIRKQTELKTRSNE